MNYDKKIADKLNLQARQVSAAIQLLDEGNTIPFIARYRKEMTFSLDELQLRHIQETVTYLRAVDDRRETILSSIDSQGKLTDQLRDKLLEAETLIELEDLYQPYKPKRMTRAIKARELGLEPLAQAILKQANQVDVTNEAKKFLTADVMTVEDALAGARDIVAEIIADDADVRGEVRDKALEWGSLSSQKIKSAVDEKETYKIYYEFESRVKWLKPYQVLAINRGEDEKVLRIKIEISERDWSGVIYQNYRLNRRSAWAEQLELAIQDSASRLLLPAIERDVRRYLTDLAQEHAIEVFADNVQGLLLQSPLVGYTVMGIDPGFRTGSKIAIVDATSKVLATGTIYPHPPQSHYDEALGQLQRWVKQFDVNLITIGNGTASRETEVLVADLCRQIKNVQYLIVNEAGASVYSASDLARDELPDLDVSLRGAVSIARRAQDPLAELVKIDPKSIGVGLYQHDVDQKQLAESLDVVVQSVVNNVGVDVNTGSIALLRYVSGVTESVARNIVALRDSIGVFRDRQMLKDVKGMGAKTFEQAAGFMRIREGDNWLDSSAIHPESYHIAKAIIKDASIKENMSLAERQQAIVNLLKKTSIEELAQSLDAGRPTVEDILEQLQRPGRDPREEVAKPILRSDVMQMENLQVGMILQGTVRNVVDFGAFVDIGVKQDGLLHKSKIPRNVSLQLGDIIQVSIESVDIDRSRIGLALAKNQ